MILGEMYIFFHSLKLNEGPNDLSNTGIRTPNKSELRDNILQALYQLVLEMSGDKHRWIIIEQ